MPSFPRQARLIASAFVLIFGLSACGDQAPGESRARPVLVVHPQPAGASVASFAGEVRARKESPLSFRVGGKLVSRKVDVGDHVEKGDLLASLDPADLKARANAARAQLAAAQAEAGRARADQARFATLAKDQLVSRSTLDAQNAAATAAEGQARAARAELEVASNQAGYGELRAPADGVIAARDAEAGQVVGVGQSVFTLAADGRREVAFAVPEGQAERIKPGLPVRIEIWSRPGRRWSGTVREVSPAADPQSRTFAARATLDTTDDSVSIGQSAEVFIDAEARAGGAGLSVPLSALQRGEGEKTAVFVVDTATGKLKLQPVRIGEYGNDRVPVIDGLAADDWVVAAGGHLLREGLDVLPVDEQNRPVLDPPRPSAKPAGNAAGESTARSDAR